MARKPRLEYPGARYHVINRGNFKQNIFDGEGSAFSFERALFQAVEKFNWTLSAYVIMSNHFHLAVELTEPNLSLGMKWLQGTWVMRNNLYLKRVGKPFQGRYKSILLEPDVMSAVVSYIHLNPRRAGIEEKGRIGTYRWSSLYWFPKKRNRPKNLCPGVALRSLGGFKDDSHAWKKYFQYLEALSESEPRKREMGFDKLSKGWCRGSREFRKAQLRSLDDKKSLLDQARNLNISQEERQDLKDMLWEQQLKQFSKDLGLSLKLLGPKKSDISKVVLAAVMKQRSSVSNQWLAKRLDMGHPASVSQFVGRFNRGNSPEKKKVEQVLMKLPEASIGVSELETCLP